MASTADAFVHSNRFGPRKNPVPHSANEGFFCKNKCHKIKNKGSQTIGQIGFGATNVDIGMDLRTALSGIHQRGLYLLPPDYEMEKE